MSNVTVTIGGRHYTVACAADSIRRAAASIRASAREMRSPSMRLSFTGNSVPGQKLGRASCE